MAQLVCRLIFCALLLVFGQGVKVKSDVVQKKDVNAHSENQQIALEKQGAAATEVLGSMSELRADLAEQMHKSEDALGQIFRIVDLDGDGEISAEEFKALNLSEGIIDILRLNLDEDYSGAVSARELFRIQKVSFVQKFTCDKKNGNQGDPPLSCGEKFYEFANKVNDECGMSEDLLGQLTDTLRVLPKDPVAVLRGNVQNNLCQTFDAYSNVGYFVSKGEVNKALAYFICREVTVLTLKPTKASMKDFFNKYHINWRTETFECQI